MAVSNLHQYIIRKSTGEMMHFHFFQNHFLGYKLYSENNLLQKTNMVVNESVLDYSVDIDENDRIHLICLTKNGELRYYIGKDETWAHKVINVFNMKTYVIRCLTFKLINKSIHIFYLIGDIMGSGLWTLKHLCWNGNEWKNFSLGDIIAGKYPPPFYVDYDSKKNIYIVFRENDGNNTQICIKKYNTEFDIWGGQERIQTNTEGINQPYLLIDTNNSLHISWSYLKDKNMQIAYKKRIYLDMAKNSWKTEMSLSNPKANCSHPVLLEINEKLYLIWNQDSILYSRTSHDMGETWSKPEILFSSKNEKVFPFTYISNYKKDPKFKGNIVYGFVRDGIRILLFESMGSVFMSNYKKADISLYNKNTPQFYTVSSNTEEANMSIESVSFKNQERSETNMAEVEKKSVLSSVFSDAGKNLEVGEVKKDQSNEKDICIKQPKNCEYYQEELINKISDMETKLSLFSKEYIEKLNKKMDDLLENINHLNRDLKVVYDMVNEHIQKSQKKSLIKKIFDTNN